MTTTETEKVPAFDLARRVRDMVTQYVYRRAELKSGIERKDITDWRNVPERYASAQQGVCESAFLTMRACRSREDFVAFFTGTICSVPQFLPEQDYRGLAEALLSDDDRWEEVKALAMLTVSALSRI